jgi:hypothetical protein
MSFGRARPIGAARAREQRPYRQRRGPRWLAGTSRPAGCRIDGGQLRGPMVRFDFLYFVNVIRPLKSPSSVRSQ